MIRAVRILQQVRKGAFSIVCTRGQSLQKERFCPTIPCGYISAPQGHKQKTKDPVTFVCFIDLIWT